MKPNPIDKHLAEFVAAPRHHAVRFPITAIVIKEGKPTMEEISVFLVRTPQLIELLTHAVDLFKKTRDANPKNGTPE